MLKKSEATAKNHTTVQTSKNNPALALKIRHASKFLKRTITFIRILKINKLYKTSILYCQEGIKNSPWNK